MLIVGIIRKYELLYMKFKCREGKMKNILQK